VYDRPFPSADDPAFDRVDVDFLGAFADQVALMIETANLDERVREAERRREERRSGSPWRTARRARRAAARVAHELRNPLASIAAFARPSIAAREGDPNREYLRSSCARPSVSSARWANISVRDPRPATVEARELNAIVQQALQNASERLVRRRVRLLKRLARIFRRSCSTASASSA